MKAIAVCIEHADSSSASRGLKRMLDAMLHRGQHCHGISSDAPSAFGSRTSLATAPTGLHREGSLQIAADARLDNLEQLRARLDLPSQATEAQVILRAYMQWQNDCAGFLLGDFAFVIYDGRNRSVYAARDCFGVKPLFFYRGAGVVAFASEIRALLHHDLIPVRVNEQRIAEYVASLHEDVQSTYHEGILRMRPATWIRIGPERFKSECYWTPDVRQELRLQSDEEYNDAFREKFLRAVERRTGDDTPIGSTLSGGLDSSSVAAAARVLLSAQGRQLHTFSAIFDDVPASDEREYAQSLTAMDGVVAHTIRGDLLSPFGSAGQRLCGADEPMLGPNTFIHDAIYRTAAANGVNIVLDGLDGDTVISHGTAYLAELFRRGQIVRLMAEAGGLARHFDVSASGIIWRRALRPVVPQALIRIRRRVAGNGRRELASRIIEPSFAKVHRIAERMEQELHLKRRQGYSQRRAHVAGLVSAAVPLGIEILEMAAARNGIEPRFPFFDRELVELTVSLPGDQKLRHGWSRYILRTALVGILPDKIRWRGGKASLAPNFYHVLRRYERQTILDAVTNHADMIDRYFDMDRLRELARRFADSKSSGSQELVLWKAAALVCWLQSRADIP